MLKLNGNALPAPKSLQISINSAHRQERRNALGDMVADSFSPKRVLSVKWQYLSETALSTLLEAINENRFFLVTYPDPETGAERVIEAYCTAQSVRLINVREDGENIWGQVEMSWMER